MSRSRSPKNLIMNLANTHIPQMRYDTSEGFTDWQERAREKLIELLGLELMENCDFDFKVQAVKEHADYTDTYFSFQSESGFYVPCHILLPKNNAENLPCLICLQGHSTGMHISIGEAKYKGDQEDIDSGDRDYARIAVKKGYCAICMEQRYMGECGGTEKGTGCIHRPADDVNALPTLLFGRTAIGERVHDVMRLIDLVASCEDSIFSRINKDDIMITGNSGGGTTSFYAGCVDTRIKYCVPSCSVCTYKDSIIDLSHCACNYIPSAARYFDMGDLAGLIAPRGLVIVAGKEDKIFPYHAVLKTFELAKSLYEASGNNEKIALVTGDCGHRYYAAQTFEKLEEMREVN